MKRVHLWRNGGFKGKLGFGRVRGYEKVVSRLGALHALLTQILVVRLWGS